MNNNPDFYSMKWTFFWDIFFVKNMDFEHVLLPCWFWLECVSSWSDDFSTSGILLTSACGTIDCCCWMSSEYIRVLFKSKNIFCECDWRYRHWNYIITVVLILHIIIKMFFRCLITLIIINLILIIMTQTIGITMIIVIMIVLVVTDHSFDIDLLTNQKKLRVVVNFWKVSACGQFDP